MNTTVDNISNDNDNANNSTNTLLWIIMKTWKIQTCMNHELPYVHIDYDILWTVCLYYENVNIHELWFIISSSSSICIIIIISSSSSSRI